MYTAVDFALITQVLPAATARAKDLGVINIANALPLCGWHHRRAHEDQWDLQRSPAGDWVGLSGRARTVVYNTDELSEDADDSSRR